MSHEPGDSIVYPEAVDERIAELKQLRVRAGEEAWTDGLYDIESDELAALQKFRADVIAETSQGAWDDSPGFISERYFAEYAEHDAAGIYGDQAVQSAYFDLDQYEEDLRAEKSTTVDFDGTTYHVDKNGSW